MTQLTEKNSLYNNLEKMNTRELLQNINHEDSKVAKTVSEAICSITNLVDIISEKISNGGRLFYIGSGTSGRLGILDASECPPTFGVSNNIIIGMGAGTISSWMRNLPKLIK